jgi:4-amino-4-deoxy-L-arabinose transferase-like glycosyltransferase
MNQRRALAVVLLIGAALRFWNIDAGLPYRIGVDEPVIAERAIHMMRTGDYHPRFYDYPSLYIYLQLIVGSVRFITGAMSGLWQSLDQFHPEHIFLWMRMLNAALGTLTIVLLYRAGIRWGGWVGLTAAGIFAFWPNHVRESHFALTDVPLTFLTTATLLLSLRAYENRSLSGFMFAGACAGLAAAAKYTGAYALVMPLLAAAVAHAPAPGRIVMAAAAGAAAAVAFLGAAPYTVLDLPAFLNGFARLSGFYRPIPFTDGAAVYVAHFRIAVGWTALILAGIGILWGTLRALRDNDLRRWSLFVVFPLLYFHGIATKGLIFARYMLPIGPFLCLFIAFAVVHLIHGIWRTRRPFWVRAVAAAAVAIAALGPVVHAGTSWPAQYGRRTTADVAYEQIVQVIPSGSGVAVERSVLRLPSSLYKQVDVPYLSAGSRQDYIARSTTYIVASSESFGRALAKPSEHAAEYEAYQHLFTPVDHCLPTIQAGAAVSGPQIIICRLDAPIH